MIDDVALFAKVPVQEAEGNSTTRKEDEACIGTRRFAYEQFGLTRHAGQAGFGADRAEVWGAEIDGEAGMVKLCTLGWATVKILEVSEVGLCCSERPSARATSRGVRPWEPCRTRSRFLGCLPERERKCVCPHCTCSGRGVSHARSAERSVDQGLAPAAGVLASQVVSIQRRTFPKGAFPCTRFGRRQLRLSNSPLLWAR